MSNSNTLSVLVSLFFKEKPEYINDALKSLYDQTYQADEIMLIVEGQLTDEHDKVLDYWNGKFRPGVLRIIHAGQVKGFPACLNLGLESTKCAYIARFDSDDECVPYRFEKQMAFLKNNPDVVLLGGQIEEFDDHMEVSMGVRRVPTTQTEIISYSKQRNPFNHQTVIYKRDIAIALGGYPLMAANEDYAFWSLFMVNKYKVANLPDILVKARTGEGLINRRSGRKYLKGELATIKYIYQIKAINLIQYLWLYITRSIGRMLPKRLIKMIYGSIRR